AALAEGTAPAAARDPRSEAAEAGRAGSAAPAARQCGDALPARGDADFLAGAKRRSRKLPPRRQQFCRAADEFSDLPARARGNHQLLAGDQRAAARKRRAVAYYAACAASFSL